MDIFVLNFHGVGPVLREIDAGERDCWISKDRFDAILDVVKRFPQVRLTVDDGNASDADVILPSLLKRNLTATFFICSGRLYQPTFLTPDSVRLLMRHGMRIGSHGVEHQRWAGLSRDGLVHELNISRKVLQEVCGASVDTAACPFGAYDRRVLSGLRKAGYRNVYTSDGGSARETNWIIPRVTVRQTMSVQWIEELLSRRTTCINRVLRGIKCTIKRLR